MLDEDECHNNMCQNGATCNGHHKGYTCSCRFGFRGERCEEGLHKIMIMIIIMTLVIKIYELSSNLSKIVQVQGN